MAGQGRTLLILAGVLLAGVGAATWLAMSDDDGSAGDAPAEDGTPSASVAAASIAQVPGRSRKQGTAGVFGEIRRTAGRAPVAGQEVLLSPARGEPYSVTTDEQGAFKFEKLPHGGPYELSAAAKGCGTIRIPGIALDRNESRNVGTLFLDPAVKLTVLVRNHMDQPLEGAVVEAFAIPQYVDWDWTKALAQLGQAPIAVGRITSDARGEAQFGEIAVGRWTFTAKKEGFAASGQRYVTLRSDQEPKPVTIWLSPGHPLDGRVVDADKKPVEGALVMAGSPSSGWDSASAPLRSRTTTDAEGRYAFASLESGDTMLWVGRGSAPPVSVGVVVVPRVPHFDITLAGTGRLAGTVTSLADGKPVEGATVRAQCWEDGTNRVGESVTDADGKYAIDIGAGAVNRLSAEKPGQVTVKDSARPQGQRVAQLNVGETVVRDLRMRPASRLTGVVKGPSGPLPGARVLVYFGQQNEGFQQKSATCGADGSYEFASLDAGVVMVTASKEGHWLEGEPSNWWEALQSADAAKDLKIELTEGGEAKRDIELKAGSSVEGVVLGPDGNPLAGVRVSAPASMENPPTGADGVFKLAGVKPGSAVSVWASKDGYRMTVTKPIAVLAGETTTGVTLRMVNQAKVRGKVTTASGAPLAEARVQLAARSPGQNNPWDEQNRWQNAARVPVRPDGTYEAPLTFSSPNQLLVRASALDLATTDSAAVDLVEGRESYEVDIVMPDGSDISGRVVAKGGDAGIAGARVSVSVARDNNVNYGWSGQQAPIWAVTDATGAFTVSHVAAATYEVRAAADGYVVEVKSAKLPADKPLLIEMSPEMSIEGVVVLGDDSPVEGVEVQATGNQTQVKTFGGIQQGPRTSITDRKGAFRVTGLAAGTWSIDVRPPWSSELNIKAKRVDGIAGGAKDVRVAVEQGGAISGRVCDPQGKGIQMAWINANPMPKEGVNLTGNEWRYAQTRADGTFTINGLGEGPYQVHVNANAGGGKSYRPARTDNVAVGTKDLRFTMETGLAITGVVNDPDGRPVSQLQIQAQPVDTQGGQAQGGGAMTDNEGRFTISGLAPGDYRFDVPQWGGPNQAWVLDAKQPVQAGTSDVRLTVGKGVTISGVLLDESGAAITQGWVSAFTKKGGNHKYAQPKPDGAWEIAGLEAGEKYTLAAQSQGRVNATVDEVAAGTKDVRISLAKGLEATGRLVDGAGKGLANVQISFTHPDGKHTQWTQTQADGRFTAAGLVEGSYEAKAWQQSADGRSGDWKSVGTIKAGDRDAELRLQ
jgi:protocatechuate 3,4-dioxygenase beta subunit